MTDEAEDLRRRLEAAERELVANREAREALHDLIASLHESNKTMAVALEKSAEAAARQMEASQALAREARRTSAQRSELLEEVMRLRAEKN